MLPEPLLHLRAAIRRGCYPDDRDIGWLSQNLKYLEALEEDIKVEIQQWMETNNLLLSSSTTTPKEDNNPLSK